MTTATITRVAPADTARSIGPGHYRRALDQKITLSQLLERDDPTEQYPAGSPERQLDAFERVLMAKGILASGDPRRGIQASTWGALNEDQQGRALAHEFCARIWRQVGGATPETPASRMLVLQGLADAEGGRNPQARNTGTMFSSDYVLNTMLFPYANDYEPRAKRLVPPVPLARLVARTTPIAGTDAYRTLYITDDFGTDAYRMKRVSEGAAIPATTLVTGEHTIRVHKFGRALRATYEQLRRQRLDRIAWIIGRMALQAEVDKVAIVINTVVNGDGNANTAATVVNLTTLDPAASAGTLTLKGWIMFKNQFTAGYTLDVILAQLATVNQVQLLAVNTINGMPLAMVPPSPLGSVAPLPMQNLLGGGVEYGITADAPSLKIIGLDTALAVERVTEIGGTISEVERYVLNQTQAVTLTESEGYGLLDTFGASRVLNVNS